MMRTLILCTAIATGITPTQAQTLFSEPFDSEATAKVLRIDDSQDPAPDIIASWIDYSDFSVEGVQHSIPEAPNPVQGGSPSRGLLLQANVLTGSAFAVNFLAADSPGGLPVDFSGNYKVSFDAYLSVADPLPSGSTEQLLWGIGSDASELNARFFRSFGSGSGIWGWLATDNDYGTEDTAINENEVERLDLSDAEAPDLFNTTFLDTLDERPNNAPANQWVHVEITALTGSVTVGYNGNTFFQITDAPADGFAFLGYEDPFGGTSSEPAYQWGLFDNFVVEVASPDTITATQLTPFEVTTSATPQTTTINIENSNSVALTISQFGFSGTDASEFSTSTPPPLVINPGTTAEIPLTWTPSDPTGEKSATLILTSDDPTSPGLSVPLNATYAPTLLAHFPLDETSGTTIVEASGNGPDGTYAENTPVGLGQPALATGTAVRFQESVFNPPNSTGNFGIIPMLHTPSISFSAWINPDADTSSQDVIINRSPKNGNTDDFYGLFLDDLGSLSLAIAGQPVVFSDLDAIADGTTYHVAFTHLDEDGFDNDSATRTRLYINGALVSEADSLTTFGFAGLPGTAQQKNLFLATRSQAAAGYSGLIDDIQIYSVELTPEQVANAFENPGTLAIDTPPTAPLTITSIIRDAVLGDVTITFTSASAKTYAVQTSNDLVTWNDDGPDSVPATGTSTTTVVTGLAASQRYFRVIQE